MAAHSGGGGGEAKEGWKDGYGDIADIIDVSDDLDGHDADDEGSNVDDQEQHEQAESCSVDEDDEDDDLPLPLDLDAQPAAAAAAAATAAAAAGRGDGGGKKGGKRKRKKLILIGMQWSAIPGICVVLARPSSAPPSSSSSPSRPGRKLLVLDIDRTLYDHKSRDLQRAKRPGLDSFMEAVYPHYDIAVWSATNWTALEAKCTEMGLLNSLPKFAVSFVLDKSAMFDVTTKRPAKKVPSNGGSAGSSSSSSSTKDRVKKEPSKNKKGAGKGGSSSRTHSVKALQVIWGKFPGVWGPHNTLHVDDLRHNFAMNRKNGIKISQYKVIESSSKFDRELHHLSVYLIHLASLPDVTTLDHKQWRQVAARLQDA
ncbi:unnamed protein product [Vitrella brassicaformis CCMP3155]|uniref:FCP1 homology domain-containing protein n=1 Tax=Vitrella brassicaformis (strain CCMP3155) TaxID=1169540 RepID=A0A0G4H4P4_VITBC|nr:unnamed protein product [Vitrella brassicaformis CCMP3155]|eukprot:CEM38764.1 unnamed protein product [Vitrella brassicaformis CCMP3155]